jgi:hypothetical protein
MREALIQQDLRKYKLGAIFIMIHMILMLDVLTERGKE